MFVEQLLSKSRPHHVQLLEAVNLDIENARGILAARRAATEAERQEVSSELRRVEAEAKAALAEHAKAGKELTAHYSDKITELRRDSMALQHPIATQQATVERLEVLRGKIERDANQE